MLVLVRFDRWDFLNFGGYEGIRHDMALAPTGMAAYNLGLKMIADVRFVIGANLCWSFSATLSHRFVTLSRRFVTLSHHFRVSAFRCIA